MKEGEKNILKFPSKEERDKARGENNEKLIEGALKEGINADTPKRVFQAIAEQAYEITKGRPFRFKRGRRVNVKRSSGEIQDDWEVLENNPSMGWIKVIRPSEKAEKKMSWTELYAINPELKVGDIVSVERGKQGSGVIENGWKIINFSFEEDEEGKRIELATVHKIEEGSGDLLEKTISMTEIKKFNP